MADTSSRPGVVLGIGLAVVAAAALAPAGLGGRPIPPWSWAVWAAAYAAGIWMFRRGGFVAAEGVRRTMWLLPVVLVFTVPAALLAPAESRARVAAALAARALAAAAAGAALAAWLGPAGLVRGARQLGAPERLADVLEATLVSLVNVLRQAKAMLRAREARRTAFGAWSDLAASPAESVRGFGRLVGALLLRSLERAEALERARRARGIG